MGDRTLGLELRERGEGLLGLGNRTLGLHLGERGRGWNEAGDILQA